MPKGSCEWLKKVAEELGWTKYFPSFLGFPISIFILLKVDALAEQFHFPPSAVTALGAIPALAGFAGTLIAISHAYQKLVERITTPKLSPQFYAFPEVEDATNFTMNASRSAKWVKNTAVIATHARMYHPTDRDEWNKEVFATIDSFRSRERDGLGHRHLLWKDIFSKKTERFAAAKERYKENGPYLFIESDDFPMMNFIIFGYEEYKPKEVLFGWSIPGFDVTRGNAQVYYSANQALVEYFNAHFDMMWEDFRKK